MTPYVNPKMKKEMVEEVTEKVEEWLFGDDLNKAKSDQELIKKNLAKSQPK